MYLYIGICYLIYEIFCYRFILVFIRVLFNVNLYLNNVFLVLFIKIYRLWIVVVVLFVKFE